MSAPYHHMQKSKFKCVVQMLGNNDIDYCGTSSHDMHHQLTELVIAILSKIINARQLTICKRMYSLSRATKILSLLYTDCSDTGLQVKTGKPCQSQLDNT